MNNDDDDQMEFEIIPENFTSNVKSFTPKGKQPSGEPTTEDYLIQGVEAFTMEIGDDAKGFIAIVFDLENNPRVICAGDIDIVTTLGALEVAKNELLKSVSGDLS